MRLTKVWIVRDPSARSELADVLWQQSVGTLDHYIHGCPDRAWQTERHAVYTDLDEALADALSRLAAKQPELVEQHRADAAHFGH